MHSRQPLPQRLDAVTLGSVMASGVEVHPHLASGVNGLLGGFTGDKGIDALLRRQIDVALTAAGAPGHGADQLGAAVATIEWFTAKALGNQFGKVGAAHRLFQLAHHGDALAVPRLQTTAYLDVEQLGELGVVTHLGVNIQRQVVGKQVDIVGQQGLEPTLLHAGDLGRFTAPEVAVMDQNGIGLGSHRRVDKRLTGGDTGHYLANALTPLHLQAVGAVILDSVRFEQMVQYGFEFSMRDHRGPLLRLGPLLYQ